jgi:hypothetical protein
MRLAQTSQSYRLYLKGREFLVGTDAEMDKSVDFFQQAVTRAPDYAMAYAGLAAVYSVQAFLGANARTEAITGLISTPWADSMRASCRAVRRRGSIRFRCNPSTTSRSTPCSGGSPRRPRQAFAEPYRSTQLDLGLH